MKGDRMRTIVGSLAGALALVLILGSAATADHTDPRQRQSQTRDPGTTTLLTRGEGEWSFIRNFPPNPGTDLKFFKKKGRLWAAAGTLGQGDEQHVGQRFIRLINLKGKVRPRWAADHGSANCQTDNTGVTSLQHDNAVTPKSDPLLMIDTTDTVGRCHDDPGGGLEIIDISELHKRKKFQPREIHLTRHVGTSHTVTVDATRPWIVYNNASQSSGLTPWIDVLDIRSCMNRSISLKAKRAKCRPKVYRIVMKPEWTQRVNASGDRVPDTDASCHDITAKPGRIYCANLNSTVVLDVRGLTDANGNVKGKPLKCELADGTNTTAKVTDCDDPQAIGPGEATGWRYVGHVNHAGRNLNNLNTEYTVREQISVSHEAEPTPDKKWMFVTDERGGGVVPGGASCEDFEANPYGNGGVHVFDISRGGEYQWAKTPDGDKAVFIGEVVVPQATFCTAHVMEQLKGEQRFTIAWYSQGTKIVDWFVDSQGRWTFREIASVIPQNPVAETWTSQVFKTVKNKDGTVTYYFMSSDISRGIDIFSWTGPRNPMGTPPPSANETRRRTGRY